MSFWQRLPDELYDLVEAEEQRLSNASARTEGAPVNFEVLPCPELSSAITQTKIVLAQDSLKVDA